MRAITYFQALLEFSQNMARLAGEQDWDELAQIESKRRSLISSFPAASLSTLPASEQVAIRALIERIQQCDKTVHEYLLPWQESVGNLLARLETKA